MNKNKILKKQCQVKFIPDNIEITVNRGTFLRQAIAAAGIGINASCGGMGVCGSCKVKIEKGKAKSQRSSRLTREEYDCGIRLACQSRIVSDVTILIPPESRLDKTSQPSKTEKPIGASATRWRFKPPLTKLYLELLPPTVINNTSDLFYLMIAIKEVYELGEVNVDFEVIRKLSATLREGNWKVTVTIQVERALPRTNKRNIARIINIEAGDSRNRHLALAVDVGTTTICSQLLDLNRGQILADTIVFNQQRNYGDDVITRIAYCQKPNGLTKLQQLVVASINDTIDILLEKSKADRRDIGHVTAAGNTTMQQILLGLDPKYIRLAPYTPTANFLPLVKAATLGIKVAEHVNVFTFPSISSYVGGDIVSGVMSAGVHQRKKLTLYMDLGTNGEIVIGNSEWMVSTSCSAGPAFEGGGIKCGMVAVAGAVQDFAIDPSTLEPQIKTIGNAKPRGICGSGLINIVAELLLNGVIDPNGKFRTGVSNPRIRQSIDGYEYVVAWAPETENGKDIVITEVDIDNLIRAKAAMYAGCQTLAHSVGITNSNFEQVILAGNFGSSLNIEKAIIIGLLPDIPRERFVFIGNGSLSGARLVNLSVDMLNASQKVASKMTNVELSDNSDFTANYMAALFLPHTDEKTFPSVLKRLSQNKKFR